MKAIALQYGTSRTILYLNVLHLFALKGKRQVYQFSFLDGYTRLAYATISSRRTT